MHRLNDGERGKLSHKQTLYISALFSGQTPTKACEAAGITPSAVSQWRRNHPHFNASLDAARQDMIVNAVLLNEVGYSKAMRTLMELCDSTNQDMRLQAAQSLVQIRIKLAELQSKVTQSDDDTRKEIADLKATLTTAIAERRRDAMRTTLVNQH